MKPVAAIIDSDVVRAARAVDHAITVLAVAEANVRERRLELGRALIAARKLFPATGRNAGGWSRFVAERKLDMDVALDAMKYAGWVDEHQPDRNPGDELPTRAQAGLDKGSAPAGSLLELRPKGARDSWCSPEWLTALLPLVDLDPCSNPRSTVRAHRTYSLESGKDGLLLPWDGLVYVNGPYSKLLPWAEKLAGEGGVTGAGFLVNADHSPGWWHVLKGRLRLRLDFDERLEFDPPPGVDPSKNDRPQTLLMDEPFWAACKQAELVKLGTLWRQI